MPEKQSGKTGRIVTWAAAGIAVAASAWAFYRPRFSARGRPSKPPSAQALALGYEPHDIDAGTIALILLVMGVVACLVVGAVFLMVGLLENGDRGRYAGVTQEQEAPVTPPLPHLQVRPFDQLHVNLERENHRLNTYAWGNADHTRARIPIDQAMALVKGQPLDPKP